MNNFKEKLEIEKRGLEVRAFLKLRYEARLRMQSGSPYVFDVFKIGTKRRYTVRFQFVRLSFMEMPNQFRGVLCNCPRFGGTSDCHHLLIAIDE